MPQTTTPLLSPLYFEAQRFATAAHNFQVRKGGSGTTPYVAHLLDVVSRLMKSGASETTLIAGWLHDTVEDTDVTLDEVRDHFGEEVAVIVASLSEGDYPPGAPKPSKRERKWLYIQQIANAPEPIRQQVRQVSCADKLSNGLDYLAEHVNNPQSPENAALNRWLYEELMPLYRESLAGSPLLAEMEKCYQEIKKIWSR